MLLLPAPPGDVAVTDSPMDVAGAAAGAAAPPATSAAAGPASGADDSMSNVFRWTLENFTKLNDSKVFSYPPFKAGGYNW